MAKMIKRYKDFLYGPIKSVWSDFLGKLSKKDRFIKELLLICNANNLFNIERPLVLDLHFRFIKNNQKKADTEDDLISCIENGDISFDGPSWIGIYPGTYKCEFNLSILIYLMLEKYIRGEHDYNEFLSKTAIKSNSIKSTYSSVSARDIKKMGKKLDKMFSMMEDCGVLSSQIKINQNNLDRYGFSPYIRVCIELNPTSLTGLINLIWDEDIKFIN